MESSSLSDVSVVTVNYNHAQYLDGFIRSVFSSHYPIAEVIVVDNASTDHSLDVLGQYPAVKVLKNAENIGYSAALNQAVSACTSPLVCITGPDVVVEPDWLEPLVKQFQKDSLANFAVVSRVLTLDRMEMQSAGSSLHFTGHLNVFEMWQSPKESTLAQPVEVGAIDSTSALLDRQKFLSIGGCDPAFFVYHEEFDYCYRARMRGWRCWYVPASQVYHGSGTQAYSVRSHGQYPTLRPFYHSRNRLYSILKNYQLRTLVIAFPVIWFSETLSFAMLLSMGMAGSYLRALRWLWEQRHMISSRRREIQPSRCLSDGRLLTADSLTISPQVIRRPWLRHAKEILDGLFKIYWFIIKGILYRDVR